MEELKVTSLSDLSQYSQGALVELPPFAEGQPFVARLKRPSLMGMVHNGKVPNELLNSASELFSGLKSTKSVNDQSSIEQVNQMYGVLETICKESFVSPTYDEIKSAGLELTDEQMAFVLSYSQKGIKALSNFRQE